METKGRASVKAQGFELLLRDVIDVGLCTACGTCVAVCPKERIAWDQEQEKPVASGLCNRRCSLCYKVCPGKDIPVPDLEKFIFGRQRDLKDDREYYLGISERCLQGYATDSKIRENGTSGGVATALLVYGMEEGLIDGAIVAAMDAKEPWRTVPKFAIKTEEVCEASRSKYVIVPNNIFLREARKPEVKKLALVGCPCHIHGLRKIQLLNQPRSIAQKIGLAIGLYCGMNYSFEPTRHLVLERFGLRSLSQIRRLEYRGGANNQHFVVGKKDGERLSISSDQRKGLFMSMSRERCSMCFDWAADLADLSVGDMFHPGTTEKVPNLTNILIRTTKGREWIQNAERKGYIKVSPLKMARVFWNTGLELKKHGSVYKLSERRKMGWPVPDYHLPLMISPFERKKWLPLGSEKRVDKRGGKGKER